MQEGCTYWVKSESHYPEHHKYVHRAMKIVPCKYCKVMFQTPSHRNNHVYINHTLFKILVLIFVYLIHLFEQ